MCWTPSECQMSPAAFLLDSVTVTITLQSLFSFPITCLPQYIHFNAFPSTLISMPFPVHSFQCLSQYIHFNAFPSTFIAHSTDPLLNVVDSSYHVHSEPCCVKCHKCLHASNHLSSMVHFMMPATAHTIQCIIILPLQHVPHMLYCRYLNYLLWVS